MYSGREHLSLRIPGEFPNDDDDDDLWWEHGLVEPAASSASVPISGVFLNDDGQWWEAAPQGFSDLPAFPNGQDGFEEYDEARLENAPAFFANTPQFKASNQESDAVIVVMGVTGAGKSTFIKTVSGRNDVVVGDSLSSETSEIYGYEFSHRGKNYILVDTPGFDDTKRNDNQITASILNWLKVSLLEGTQLNGVIYLHRISDPRMGGMALRNNRMFRKLCGGGALTNVVLATTFWEGITADVGMLREKELRENPDFWGGMLEKGARMVRLQKDRKSGLSLIEQISASKKIVLDAQDELVNAEREELERFERELEAEREAAQMQMIIEQERAQKEQEERLRQEQERLKRQREAERLAEEQRQAVAKWKAQKLYEKQLEELRKEKAKQEEKIRREKAEMKRKEREWRQRQKAREEAAAAEVVRKRKQYQANYVCIGLRPRWVCDRCQGKVERYKKYYHCCFCDSDRYFHCQACGNDCGEATHPYMTQKESRDCIAM